MKTRLLLPLVVAGLAFPATASAAGPVVINEVDCGKDWIELANTSNAAVDVSGWMLTDDKLGRPGKSHRYVFREGRKVPANGYVTVRKGKVAGLPFGLSCGGDTIRLARSVASTQAVDQEKVPKLTRKRDGYGRYPTVTGAWRQTVPTKRAPNEPSTAKGTPEPDLSWLFEPTTVHEIWLTLPQASQDALATQPRQYVRGTFAIKADGVSYRAYDVGIRLKGDSSFRPLTAKSAFRIKFDHVVKGQEFHGLPSLTLNNMIQDRSMLHEAVSYEAFRRMGLPASRSGYAFVRVNGAAYGLYANVETINNTFLRQWPKFFPTTRHVYEGETRQDVVPGVVDRIQVEEGNPADRSDLQSLMYALGDPSQPYSQRMAPFADLVQMTNVWAVEKYLGHEDGYSGNPNNYYLHSDAKGMFRMIPSGMDKTLADRVPYGPTRSSRDAEKGTPGAQGGQLFQACVGDPTCKQAYLAAVGHARRTIPTFQLAARVDQIAAALRPWQERDPRREHTREQIDAKVAETRAFLQTRSADHVWNGLGATAVGDPGLPPAP